MYCGHAKLFNGLLLQGVGNLEQAKEDPVVKVICYPIRITQQWSARLIAGSSVLNDFLRVPRRSHLAPDSYANCGLLPSKKHENGCNAIIGDRNPFEITRQTGSGPTLAIHCQAAGHADDLTRHEVRVVARQECDDPGNIFRLPEAL